MEVTGARQHLALVRTGQKSPAPSSPGPGSYVTSHAARPRLLAVLGSTEGPPLTVISGPAGSGKSVLVRGWVHSLPEGTWAWARVDDDDGNLERFWSTIASAVSATIADAGFEALHLLATGTPSGAAMRSLLQDLAHRTKARPIVIVIEDYHLVRSAEVDAQLTWFVEHLPAHCRVVITSRSEPRLGLGRMRVRSELAEIRWSDLAFRLDEATALFAEFEDLALDAPTIQALAERTEGWAAGLQLAALALRRSTEPQRILERFSGSTEGVARFLIEEVLERQDPQVREFLLSTSVLPTFSADLCAAVTQDPASHRLLRALATEELFLVPIEGVPGWFRYHRLFAELLQVELQAERPGEALELHRRASQWLVANGRPAEAIQHLLDTHNDEARGEALDLVLTHHVWLANNGASGTVRRVFASVSESKLLADPERALDLVWAMGFSGMPGPATQLLARVEAALPPTFSSVLRGRAALLHSLASAVAGRLDDALTSREAARALFGDEFPLDDASVRLPLFLGRCFTLADRFEEADASLDAARQSASAGSLPLWIVEGARAESLLRRGDFQRAERVAVQAISAWRADGAPKNPGAGDALRTRSALFAEAGDFNQAWALLDEATALLGGSAGIGVFSAVRTITARATLLYLGGHHHQALDRLAGADGGWEEFPPGPLLDSGLAEVEVRASIAIGDFRRAAAASTRLVGSAVPLLQARLSLANDDIAAAQRQLDLFDPGAPVARQVEAAFLGALAWADDPKRASLFVRRAVALGLDAGFGSSLTEPALRPQLEVLAGETGWAALSHILRRFPQTDSPAALPGTPERLTDREAELLRLLPTHLTNKELSEQLYVSLNTVKSHLKSLYRKLDATSRSDAVAKARAAHLIAD